MLPYVPSKLSFHSMLALVTVLSIAVALVGAIACSENDGGLTAPETGVSATQSVSSSTGAVGESVSTSHKQLSLDTDEDGVPDDVDNCPEEANTDQVNGDRDDLGDACDACPDAPLDDCPARFVIDVIDTFQNLGLERGIDSALGALLESALRVLEDPERNSDAAAVPILEAFVHLIETHRGGKIPEGDANAPIELAEEATDHLQIEEVASRNASSRFFGLG